MRLECRRPHNEDGTYEENGNGPHGDHGAQSPSCLAEPRLREDSRVEK
jgi:hypothetical protein